MKEKARTDTTGTRDLDRNREVRRVTWTGLIVNVCLAALKFAGGTYGHSQAVVADAVHSLSDITTDVAILVGVRYWTKPADAHHPHGHRRLETLVTIGIGTVLIVVATGLVWNAVATLAQHHKSAPGPVALAAALLSIITKELLYRWTAAAGRRIKSTPLVANAWHHRSDALSSIPAVLAVGGALLVPSWSFLDHIGTIAVSLFIYQAAFKIIAPEVSKLIDRGAPQEVLGRIQRTAEETPGVRRVHRLRTRYVGGVSLAVDLHIKVDGDLSVREGHDISEEVRRRLIAEGPDIVDVIVHLEPHGTARPGG